MKNTNTETEKPARLSPRRKTALKIIVVSALGLLALYCLYATIGQYLIWLEQPRFVHTGDGSLAWSTGFVIQLVIFGVLFLALAAADIVLAVKFFRRKKVPAGAPDGKQTGEKPDDDPDGGTAAGND